FCTSVEWQKREVSWAFLFVYRASLFLQALTAAPLVFFQTGKDPTANLLSTPIFAIESSLSFPIQGYRVLSHLNLFDFHI
ncbi:MAG: hypothetical protein MSS85_06485, partial [Pyramidobacter sp.]|uniref:hypothetical protein n=1 Tax=Pyramidobacter sp. TaxID=1943581 RepID=UPI0025E64BEF